MKSLITFCFYGSAIASLIVFLSPQIEENTKLAFLLGMAAGLSNAMYLAEINAPVSKSDRTDSKN